MKNAATSLPKPADAQAFLAELEASGHALLDRACRAELTRAQIAAAKAQEDTAVAVRDEARARATVIADNKSEGSAARARKADLPIFAAMAESAGYLNGTDKENARALIAADEKRKSPILVDSAGEPMSERTVEARFKAARQLLAEHNKPA